MYFIQASSKSDPLEGSKRRTTQEAVARPASSPGHGDASSPGHAANTLGLCNSPIPICGSYSARGGEPPPEAGRPGSAMSALFNFNSFLTVVLLVICTCTYIKIQFPAILNDRTGCGVLVKICYHGERLSPWVALGWDVEIRVWQVPVVTLRVVPLSGKE
uniref:Protein kish n=2 Tax=Oryza TaxID=4527 RepID=A0A0E0HBH4_ORYNI